MLSCPHPRRQHFHHLGEMLFNCTVDSPPTDRFRNAGSTSTPIQPGRNNCIDTRSVGQAASTMGDDSSTLRPTLETMRSMICIRCGRRGRMFTFCSRPPFSTNTWSLSLTRMSEILDRAAAAPAALKPKTSSRSRVNPLLLVEVQRYRWSDMISFTSPTPPDAPDLIHARQLLRSSLRSVCGESPLCNHPGFSSSRFTFHSVGN